MEIRRRAVVIRNRYFVLGDVILTVLSAILSFAIRLDIPLFWSHLPLCLFFVCVALVIKLPIYYLFGLYRRYWRYASVKEIMNILGATTLASLLLAFVSLVFFVPAGWSGFPRSALVIDWLLSMFLVGGMRFSVRSMGEIGPLRNGNDQHAGKGKPQRVLVVGAGDAGAKIVKEMRNNPEIGLIPIGYVDDDVVKVGMRIHDLPVLGSRESIPKLVQEFQVDQVLIAMPTAPGLAIREIIGICESTPIAFKTIPGMHELLNGGINAGLIREVQIEDLLRRDPVRINPGDAAYLSDKVILVTGAGGSIGSELCRQVAHQEPRHVILLGHGEHSIYLIYQELLAQFPELRITPFIADVRDKARLQRIFHTHGPDVIFHAAAHKHVPLMELNPQEAVTNNVMGTRNVIEVAEELNAERLVLISTDKAVHPVNLMGATKRIAELMIQDAARRTGLNFSAVRFGNVLGSRGSVVPLFKRQIAAGGPLTVTHPSMERYFMTIPEAVYLVLQAAALGEGGELYVLDMGEPVKIVDLATDLITLSGLRPNKDIEIRFSGIRPGEKLKERLFLEGEDYARTEHHKIFVFKGRPPLAGEELGYAVERLIQSAQAGTSNDEIWTRIRSIVSESEIAADQPFAARLFDPQPDVDQVVPVRSAS